MSTLWCAIRGLSPCRFAKDFHVKARLNASVYSMQRTANHPLHCTLLVFLDMATSAQQLDILLTLAAKRLVMLVMQV
jgi:hypothetical protein